MKDLLKRLLVSVVEPPNVFEQLEERIVLDATVDQVQVNGADVTANPQASVAEDATSVVDIHSVSEGSGGTYSLKVDGQDVAAYNAGNGDKADVDVSTDNFAATGKFSWTPNNLDVGIHSFEVTANDGGSGAEPHTDIETIQLTVYNVAPTFSSGAVATFVADSGGQTFDAQSSDENLGSTYSLDGAPGWLSIDPASGVISGNPTYSHTGDYSFAVRVNDGHVSVDQDFILTVNNTLDFISATSQTRNEDEAFLYDARTDTEALGKPVTYSLQPGAPAWLSIDSETGVVTGNPDNSHVGVHTFTVHAESTEGSGNLNFTLTVQNTPPVFLNQEPTIQMIESSGPQTFDVQNNDESTPSGLAAYSILSYDGIDYGAVGFPAWLAIDDETGIITGNPLNQDVGVHTIVVQFDDGNSPDGVRTHIFNLDVDNVLNYFESSNATTWVEDAADQSFNVQTHEEGVIVEPAHVTYSFAGGALTWGGWLRIDANTGVLSPILGTQPDNSKVGTHVFDIWSNEGYGAPVVIQEDFTLTVMNAVPVITSPAVTQIQEDAGSSTFQVTLASPEPGATYSLQYAPNIHGNPVTIDAATGLMTIPAATNVDVGGTYLFNVVVNDTHGGIATQFFRIDVTNVDPVFTQLPDPLNDPHVITVNEDSSYTFDINVPAPINDEGDGPTSYSLVGQPGFVSIDSSTGQISVNNPGNNDVGTHNFTVQLNDGHGGVASASIRLVVNNVAPDIPAAGSVTWYEDGDTNLDGTPDGQGWQTVDVGTPGVASDEGQGATYSLVGAPSWLTINAGTGAMSYVPANANVGTHVFTVHIDDGHGGSDDQTFTLDILNSPPKFDGLYGSGNTTLYVNQSGGVQVFDPQTTDEGSNRSLYGGTPNQYSLISAPAGITLLNPTTGQFSADPAVLGLGSFGFTIRFFDGSVSVDQAVTVVVTNIPPNATDPVNFDPGFYSPNNTSFIEDTGNQTFNIQYQTEGTSGTLRYDLMGAPSWLVFQDTGTQTGSSTGVITADPNNIQTTDVNPGTPYAFQIRVYDPAASLDFNTDFALAVTNNPPLFNEAPFNVVFTEDQDYTAASTPYDVNTTDEPHDNPSYPNTYSLANGTDIVPTWLKITNDGKIYIDRGVAGPDQHRMVNDDANYGPWNLKVVFNDAHGGVIDRAITVSVQNVLQFQDPGHHYAVVWQEDATSPFNTTTFEAMTDDDPSSARHVTYSLTNIPGWLMDGINPRIGIDPDTGVVFMRPGYESTAPNNTIPGTYFFTIVANDTHGTSTQNVSITVPNRDPVFAQTVFNIGEDNGADVINLQVDDEGQGATYYTWSGAPQWMSLDPFTGEITTD
ncbi:MAG: putative Ig domain-containing protein, partial [Thermodesulfobacteriota bacterium]